MMPKTSILITLLFFMFSNAPIQAQPAEMLLDTSKIMESFRRLSIDKQIEYIENLSDIEVKTKDELITLLTKHKRENISQEEIDRVNDLLIKLPPKDYMNYLKVIFNQAQEYLKQPGVCKEVMQKVEAASKLSQEQKKDFIKYIESGKTIEEYLLEIGIYEDSSLKVNIVNDRLSMLTFAVQVARWDKMTNITNKDIEDYLTSVKPTARAYQGIAELYLTRKIKGSEDDWYKRAVDYYEKALALDTNSPSIYSGLLCVYFYKFEDYQDRIPKTLKEAEKIDSENAVYDYLLAYYYFTTDKEKLALTQIETGSKKPYLNFYQIEGLKAAIEVAEEFDIEPITTKVLIGDLLGPIKAYDLWSLVEKMQDIASEREKEKRWKEARDMYNYLIRLSEQATEAADTLLAKSLNANCRIHGCSGLARYYEKVNQTEKASQMKEKAQLAKAERDSMKKGRYSKLGGPLLGMGLIYIELGREDFEKFLDERFLEGRDGEYLIEAGKVDTFKELIQMVRDKFLQ